MADVAEIGVPRSDMDLEAWANTLPFPSAAVLWVYLSSTDDRARFDSLFHFFEVTARTLVMLLLSGLIDDQQLFAQARPSWQGRSVPPSVTMRRPTLGSWVRFHADLSKASRALIHANPTDISRAFRVVQVDRIATLASRPVVSVLAEAVTRRNDWRGHDAAVSPTERAIRVAAMSDLVHRLREGLGPMFDGWHLIEPGPSTKHGDVHQTLSRVLVGPNRRFRSSTVTSHRALDADRLYIHEVGHEDVLVLVPWMRIVRPTARDEAAVYVYDRVDGDDVRWISYDAEDIPELTLPATASQMNLLASLDAPDRLGTGQVPEPPELPEPPDVPKPTPATEVAIQDPEARAGETLADRARRRIVSAIRLTEPGMVVGDSGAITSAGGSVPIGWFQAWPRSLVVTAHVPIELAPQLAGMVISEVPVTAASRAGVRLTVDDERDWLGASILLLGALALERGSLLAGEEHQAALAIALPGNQSARNTLWGAGDRPPSLLSGAELESLWVGIEKASTDRWADLDRSVTGHRRPSLRVHEHPDVELRVDARSLYVVTTVHDREGPPGWIDRMLQKPGKVERFVGTPLSWHRRLDSLAIIDRIDAMEGPEASTNVAPIVFARVAAIAQAVKLVQTIPR